MNQYTYVENALSYLEKYLKVRLTVIDWDGLFNYKQKFEVFNASRHSHQTIPTCKSGFGERCIKNCRFRMNRICQEKPEPCCSTCWKGIVQIAVPLRYMNVHYGVLYAGNFSDPENPPPEGLPRDFYLHYKKLPVCSEEKKDELMSVLSLFAKGMILYLRNENIINDDYDFRVGKIYAFLEKNSHRHIGLPDMAEALNLSETYTSIFIKHSTGQNFSQLLRSIRIEKAKKILVTTEDNLHIIAEKCGFSSEFHLSKVFKEITGLSPSVFRSMN